MFIFFGFHKYQTFAMIPIWLVCFLALDLRIGICCLTWTSFHIYKKKNWTRTLASSGELLIVNSLAPTSTQFK
jgi:hypothetical protein